MKIIIAILLCVIVLFMTACHNNKDLSSQTSTILSQTESQTSDQNSSIEQNTVSSQLSNDIVKDKIYSFDKLPNVEVPKVDIQKITFYDDSMGEIENVTAQNDIEQIMNILHKLEIYNEEIEPNPTTAKLSRGCLYWLDFYEFADDEYPAFSIGFDSFFIDVGGEKTGPYRTENGESIIKEILHLFI